MKRPFWQWFGPAVFVAAMLASLPVEWRVEARELQEETAALEEEARARASLETAARSALAWSDRAVVTGAEVRFDAFHVGSSDRYRRIEIEASVTFTTPHRRGAWLADSHFWGPDCWAEHWRRARFPRHRWGDDDDRLVCEIWSVASGAGARHELRARGVLERRR